VRGEPSSLKTEGGVGERRQVKRQISPHRGFQRRRDNSFSVESDSPELPKELARANGKEEARGLIEANNKELQGGGLGSKGNE